MGDRTLITLHALEHIQLVPDPITGSLTCPILQCPFSSCFARLVKRHITRVHIQPATGKTLPLKAVSRRKSVRTAARAVTTYMTETSSDEEWSTATEELSTATDEPSDSSGSDYPPPSVARERAHLASTTDQKKPKRTPKAAKRTERKQQQQQVALVCSWFECMQITFNTPAALQQHKTTYGHCAEFACTACTFETSQLSRFHTHCKTHSKALAQALTKTTFNCEFCDYQTNNEVCLVRHVLTRHDSKLPFSCMICQFHTASRAALETHVATHPVETHPASFQCDRCDETLFLRSSLYAHNACIIPIIDNASDGSSSSDSSSSTSSSSSSSDEAGASNSSSQAAQRREVYTCGLCSTSFRASFGLIQHLRQTHLPQLQLFPPHVRFVVDPVFTVPTAVAVNSSISNSSSSMTSNKRKQRPGSPPVVAITKARKLAVARAGTKPLVLATTPVAYAPYNPSSAPSALPPQPLQQQQRLYTYPPLQQQAMMTARYTGVQQNPPLYMSSQPNYGYSPVQPVIMAPMQPYVVPQPSSNNPNAVQQMHHVHHAAVVRPSQPTQPD